MNPDDEHYIGYLITDVGRLLRTVFERRVRAFGLTRAQWIVIARVHRRPGLSQSEVADLLEIEKAPAGRLIDRMQAKGWLERRDDANDRRINRLHLTPAAERLHATIWPLAEATVDLALCDLSPDERRRLTALMARVKGRLQALAEHDPAVAGNGREEAEEREAHAL
jgi:DNA-binding MarR family transcriptional regulator